MKHLFPLLLCALLLTGAASAQRRFQVGVRGGVTTTSHTFFPRGNRRKPIPARSRQGGLSGGLRPAVQPHPPPASAVGAKFRIRQLLDPRRRLPRPQRFEIPLLLGLQFGPLRLFGGAQFRVADSERDSAPKLLKVNFNDDVGIMGGVGFNIRKFFFDFRLSGYARSHVWNTFVSDGVSQRVRIPRNLVYGGSVGFFF